MIVDSMKRGASSSETSRDANVTAPQFSGEVQRSQASVTIIVSFRERWRFTPLTIQTIIKNTNGEHALWLLDPGMPEDIRAALDPHVQAGELEIIKVIQGQHPNDARAQIVSKLSSPFAVFIDNDVVVTPGWLDSMVACAEETKAGIVCPLYLWGGGQDSDLIHMAGGDLTLVPADGGLRMTEQHRLINRKASDVADELCRGECGFGEFHCLMMRREVYSADGVFDPNIASVHEHIHASLKAKELGFDTWFEPAAQVNYLAFAPWTVGELHDFRHRWDFATAERSLEGFAKKWQVIDDPAYRSSTLRFVISHVGQADLLDARPWLSTRRDRLMERADLQETFAGCEWLILKNGYSIEDLEIFANAYTIAIEHTNGVYRPCGRPFINHLVGTASVLLFYGCSMRLVLAGLLHALFGNGATLRSTNADRAYEQVTQLGSAARHAARIVQIFSERARLLDEVEHAGASIKELTTDLASIYLLEAANEVDMHLSFEAAVSGRSDLLTGTRFRQTLKLLEEVGLPGLAGTLRTLKETITELPNVSFQGGAEGSFQFHEGRIVSAHR